MAARLRNTGVAFAFALAGPHPLRAGTRRRLSQWPAQLGIHSGGCRCVDRGASGLLGKYHCVVRLANETLTSSPEPRGTRRDCETTESRETLNKTWQLAPAIPRRTGPAESPLPHQNTRKARFLGPFFVWPPVVHPLSTELSPALRTGIFGAESRQHEQRFTIRFDEGGATPLGAIAGLFERRPRLGAAPNRIEPSIPYERVVAPEAAVQRRAGVPRQRDRRRRDERTYVPGNTGPRRRSAVWRRRRAPRGSSRDRLRAPHAVT